ncbi:MAG: DNA polymerase III subunit epsilon [Hydrogenophaga sp.]|uniref:3'-5' exonuclease n=1 Tax=Hydrogenophaga sp. TaxID=1904254 RepID=UPI001D942281|nr:exonuclease domain-containing protein [Hydrogenophaga sp.]MBX3609836.1 DNA polymerase III subunit epsilon [Hydrogenophaga sp.]
MKPWRHLRFWLLWSALTAAPIALLSGAYVLLSGSLAPGDLALLEQTLSDLLQTRVALLGLLLVVYGALVAAALVQWWQSSVTPLARLAEHIAASAEHADAPDLPLEGDALTRTLAAAANRLIADRRSLACSLGERIEAAGASLEQERSRLAALMSELTQSVIACNLDGRVLLYNPSALALARGLSSAPAVAAGCELLGLGRSVHALIDPRLIDHALGRVRHALQQGKANPTSSFLAPHPGGQVLRVQLAPVRHSPVDAALTGYLLVLEDVTKAMAADAGREQAVLAFSDTVRSTLAALHGSAGQLGEGALQAQLAEAMPRVEAVSRQAHDAVRTTWLLEDMLGADLLDLAAQRMSADGVLSVEIEPPEQAWWLRVDSHSLVFALCAMAERLASEYAVRRVALRLRAGARDGEVQLDLVWQGQALSAETVMGWELDSLTHGGEALGLSLRDVAGRHRAAVSYERERARHESSLRLALPLADAPIAAPVVPTIDSRPEFYDFDLFKLGPVVSALDDARLVDLSFTVFDTETTGLDPSAGDEIIQIGAARIVNGRLLRGESFEQLVDPRRPIPAATIPIHGIRPEMVVGQPTIEKVLPAFHAYARDTVLVAHNAAFDMRFLQLKAERTGVHFDQPVLDTLLLASIAQPNQPSHRLEAIAERFGVTVTGRHTALGDALATAEILLKLVPLLAAQGIHTLHQAREASQRSYLARLRY